MNTAQLQCFLTVADTLNFAQAAQRLHITQPAVTQQIHALEKELGIQLFHRTTHSVRLTYEGLLFLADARQIASIANRARKRFSQQSAERVESLSIGCMYSQLLPFLSRCLGQLRKAHPNLHPQMQVVPFQHIYRMLDEGSLDVVAGFQDHLVSNFLYRELVLSPMVCVCGLNHLLASLPQVSQENLQGVPLVLPVPSLVPTSVRHQHETLLEDRTSVDLYPCDSVAAVLLLVSSGFGVSVLPSLLASYFPGIVCRPLTNSESVSFGLYYKSLKDQPLLKDFVVSTENSDLTL